VRLRDLVDRYAGELAEAQAALRSAWRGEALDAQALARELAGEPPSPARLLEVAGHVDPARLDRATTLFANATARFISVLRDAEGRIVFPNAPSVMRRPSAWFRSARRATTFTGPTRR